MLNKIPVEKEKIRLLQKTMALMPQAPNMFTSHFFAGGMYCRRMEIPYSTIIVSKVHKTEHLFIGCSGELQVAGQGDTYTLRSGDVKESAIGTKRLVVALTDVVVMTIHRTGLISLDGLEEELMRDEGAALYDINNNPKDGILVSNPMKPISKEDT